jgi:tetratricopeptide (TPR) repeat protein
MRGLRPRLGPAAVRVLDRAKALMAEGKITEALATYAAAFDELVARGDHFAASNVAHLAGVADPDPAAKMDWNTKALREADAVADRDSVASFYPSLYNNLAFSHSLLGNREEALRCLRTAWSHRDVLELGPYADRVTGAIKKRIAELEARR